jgi:hypothetical protein
MLVDQHLRKLRIIWLLYLISVAAWHHKLLLSGLHCRQAGHSTLISKNGKENIARLASPCSMNMGASRYKLRSFKSDFSQSPKRKVHGEVTTVFPNVRLIEYVRRLFHFCECETMRNQYSKAGWKKWAHHVLCLPLFVMTKGVRLWFACTCVTNLTVQQPSLDGVTHSPEERGMRWET